MSEQFLWELAKKENIFWTSAAGDAADVVLSTRVRLARNYKEYLFPHKIGDQQRDELIAAIQAVIVKDPDLYYFDLRLLPEDLRIALFEKQLISKELAVKSGQAALIINKNNDLSIMINEEDHLRIQAYESGLAFKAALEKAVRYDEIFATASSYAFDNELGFHTSCPSNFGTGMRASVMVHLPALVETGALKQMTKDMHKAGYVVRGMYGESTESWGGFFQISNQLTTGLSEEEIIQRLSVAMENLARQERAQRRAILEKKRIFFEDHVYRAYGLLRHARRISHKEAVLNLSLVRAAVNEQIIPDITLEEVNKLIFISNPYHIKALHKDIDEQTISQKRAEMIRARLADPVE